MSMQFAFNATIGHPSANPSGYIHGILDVPQADVDAYRNGTSRITPLRVALRMFHDKYRRCYLTDIQRVRTAGHRAAYNRLVALPGEFTGPWSTYCDMD